MMGCSASKNIDATTPYVHHHPPQSGFSVFDINAIEEPWLKLDSAAQLHDQQKSPHVPPHLLEKLDMFEKGDSDDPRTWEELSKALEVLKKKQPETKPSPGADPVSAPPPKMTTSFAVHTLEELEAKKKDDDKKKQLGQVRKTESTRGEEPGENEAKKQLSRLRKTESTRDELPSRVDNSGGASGSLKANPFILRDRMEKEKEGEEAVFDKIMKSKRDPLGDFPEVCPPGGSHLVVLYTTSLGGVRKTFEDCNHVRAILENHRVVVDERDVSLHHPFVDELKELVGSADGAGVPVPRLFVKGRYLGGGEEVMELNESGRLGRILSSARVERGVGWQGCEGCGGARFVPCLECGGSCKLIVRDNEKERCPKCNENGLVQCPLCH